MCIIGLNPSGARRIPTNTLRRCQAINSDGMGIAFTERNGLKVYKTLDDFEGLLDRYEWAQENDQDVLVHFRLQTVGIVDLENCHPFWADDNIVFGHNGTFSDVYCDDRKSDTRAFRDQVLRDLPEGWLWDEGYINLLEYAVGHNRVAFMDDLGRYQILNEESGVWWNGTWWSNTGFMPRRQTNETSGKVDGGSSNNGSISQWADDLDEQEDDKSKSESNDDSHTAVVFEGGEFVRQQEISSDSQYWEDYEINPHGCFYKSKPVCYGCLPSDADDDDCHVIIDDGNRIFECEYCGVPIAETNTHAVAARRGSREQIPIVNRL